MAYSQTDLANITSAISKGVLRARIGGEEVQYRSLGEMLRIKRLIEADLAPAGAARSRTQNPVTSSGW